VEQKARQACPARRPARPEESGPPMTAASIAMGFLLALAIGFLIGHRMGMQDGMHTLCLELEKVDTDHTMLREFWAKWRKGGR
jgi:hypothetical protein